MLPVPLSRMVAPYATMNLSRRGYRGTAIFIPVTNAVEALHRSLRKIIKTRGSFPNDDAALKLLSTVAKPRRRSSANNVDLPPLEQPEIVTKFSMEIAFAFEVVVTPRPSC